MHFYLELRVFWGVPVRKKTEILESRRDSLYFQVFSGHFFYCLRGSSLVEMTGDDNSAADIILNVCMATESMDRSGKVANPARDYK